LTATAVLIYLLEFDVMFTPGIAIDSEVKSVGKVLSVRDIKRCCKENKLRNKQEVANVGRKRCLLQR